MTKRKAQVPCGPKRQVKRVKHINDNEVLSISATSRRVLNAKNTNTNQKYSPNTSPSPFSPSLTSIPLNYVSSQNFQPETTISPEADKDVKAYQSVSRHNHFPCHLDGCTHICTSAGDLRRHQQSLRHQPPSFPCLACRYTFTRPDALKRHLMKKPACKRAHQVECTAEGDWGSILC
ncbi:hypothetical protein SERLA73DRAFT_182224 [Serpula lacrymans var. lacrymans S7.3]|uniref:C2H2-type domain-containing protein n=1 Tax=Serpula lacrymans var. lacrymans (strain S7.3) TaxID=936435 RepID=F8PWW0_SERL3|nr:hypothetical protein SERLA73DRAFT_182224 [Serpula lacrymans var. lacrymans S7.3]